MAESSSTDFEMTSKRPETHVEDYIEQENAQGPSHSANARSRWSADATDELAYEVEPDEDYRISFRTWCAILALALATSCAPMTSTVNTTIQFQVQTVGGASKASWIANSSFLTTVAFGPILGFLSDRLGKKWFIVISGILGIAGSCISGSAHHIESIIGGNAIQGVANAGCLAAIPAIQEIVPNKKRPLAVGISQMIQSVFAVAGVLIAGGLVKHVHEGWRYAYYVNAAVYGTSAVLVGLTYFPPPTLLRRQQSLNEIARKVDIGGALLLSGSIASIVTGLTWGGETYPWSSSRVIATLVCGCAGLVILGLYEAFVVKEGLFDHRLFQSRNFPILLFICIIDGMLLLGINVLYPQQIADFFTQDAVKIGGLVSPFLIVTSFGCLPVGFIFAKTKKYRAVLTVALVWAALFTGLMALGNTHRLAMMTVFSVLFGIGCAVTTVVPITALSLSVPSMLLGGAGLLSQSARALGGIIGSTLFTAIYDNKFFPSIAETVPPVAAANHLPNELIEAIMAILHTPLGVGGLSTELGLGGPVLGELAAAVSVSQVYAWRYVWAAIAAVIGVGALCSLTLKDVSHHMNDHIESALEKSETRQSQMTLKH